MTAQEPTWIATLPAAAKVRRHALDAADEARLLDILGLVGPDGAIVPDDVRNYDIPSAGPEAPTRSTAADHPAVRDLHPERCSTPAGLRWLDGAA